MILNKETVFQRAQKAELVAGHLIKGHDNGLEFDWLYSQWQ